MKCYWKLLLCATYFASRGPSLPLKQSHSTTAAGPSLQAAAVHFSRKGDAFTLRTTGLAFRTRKEFKLSEGRIQKPGHFLKFPFSSKGSIATCRQGATGVMQLLKMQCNHVLNQRCQHLYQQRGRSCCTLWWPWHNWNYAILWNHTLHLNKSFDNRDHIQRQVNKMTQCFSMKPHFMRKHSIELGSLIFLKRRFVDSSE